MITGYNTDVRHDEVVFHVQTEDKGTANPFIESLVYVGGQVLAAKRASYAQLLSEGKGEKEILALMDHQHRAMIAAIRHGRFDDKLAALTGGRALRQPAAAAPADGDGTGAGTDAESGDGIHPPVDLAPEIGSATVISTLESERTLDQVILEYLTSEAEQEQLVLMLDGERNFVLGERASVALRASSSKSGRGVVGAQVSVRMISTIAEPRTLAAGQTDGEGAIELAFDIPRMDSGTSALIVTAASPIGSAEIKHLL